MSRLSAFHFLCLFFAFPVVQSYETPSLEVVVVIKATVELTNQTYFNYEILPFIEELSNFLIFPEEIGNGQPDFARISVNIGGNDDVWPEAQLKNLSRSGFSLVVQKLVLPEANDTESGCERALEAALQTYYSSSVALYRVTVLITDSVTPSDAKSLAAINLQSISNAIYVVGISSADDSNFDDSLAAAADLALLSNYVFPTITAAANTSSGIGAFIKAQMEASTRPCAGYIFAYADSGDVDASIVSAYVDAAESFAKAYLSDDDAYGIASFSNIVYNEFAFLSLSKLKVDSDSNNENVDMASVLHSLLKISQRTKFNYMGIVLLTSQSTTSQNAKISVSQTTLGNLTNTDLFVLKISNSGAFKAKATIINENDDYLNKKSDETLANGFDKFENLFKDHVLPVFANSQCGFPITTTTIESDSSITTASTTSAPASTTQVPATTSGGSLSMISVASLLTCFVAYFLAL